ncbi:MAG: porin family protein [Candidatus Cryptobacteroides sp.]
MKKIILSFALLALVAGSAVAQNIGVSASYLNSTQLTQNDPASFNGFQFGVSAEKYFDKNFGFATGLSYSYLGRKTTDSQTIWGQTFTGTTKTNEHYLTLPLHAAAKMEIQKGISIFLEAGPALNLGLASKTNVKGETSGSIGSGSKEQTIDNYDPDYNYGRFDLLLGAQAGFRYNNCKFFVGYNYGLIDRDKTPDNDSAVSHRSEFSVGVSFLF